MAGKVLSLSQRRVSDLVAHCVNYEFEDIFADLTNASRIETKNFQSLERSRRIYKLVHSMSRSAKLARLLAPSVHGSIKLQTDYEFFFPQFNHTYELYSLATIPNWRKRCNRAACFILESWSDMLPGYLIELLSDFDHIFLGCHNSVNEIARLTGRPCTYLPLAVDVLRFAPSSADQPRPIDVSYIGRRSPITHNALMAHAMRQKFFYYYDTVSASGMDRESRTFRVDAPEDHRRLLATLLKNSRYFFANRSYVNRPQFTVGREEISPRFYEGAASGTVMIGVAPKTSEFRKQFDWPDAVIHVPFDSADVGAILTELDSNQERLRAIRHNNLRNAALRHDWLHRIRTVFDVMSFPYTEKMHHRAQQLDEMARSVPAV